MSHSLDRRGFAATFAAFVTWGLFPLYWYPLREVPALQTVAHRVVWCALLVVPWLAWREGAGWLRRAVALPRVVPMLMASSVLISINWGVYIWAVTHGHVIEASLGYFINPLVNVLLGVVLLRERLTQVQWAAVAIATAGVLYMSWQLHAVPVIALALAFSFGSYGLIRKIAAVDSITGLGVESVFLFLPALGFLVWSQLQGSGAFGHIPAFQNLLLILGGAMTALPLIGFAYGARRIPLSLVGVIQYVTPSLQFACGYFVFGEPFTHERAVGFALIWAALLIYAAEGLWRSRRHLGLGSAAAQD